MMFLFRKNSYLFIAVFLSLLFFIMQFLTLSHYGINWDEVGHYNRGQQFLHYFLTGEKNYETLQVKNVSIFQKPPATLTFDYWVNVNGHPPLNDIFASLSNYFFYQNLGIIGDIESYHFFIIFVSSVLVGLVVLWTAQAYGIFPALVSCLALVFYPLFLGESHFNIKDPVQSSFYALTLYTFYKAVVKNSWKIMLLSSVFAGFALGTKFNILFAPFIIVPWILIYYWKKIKLLKWPFSPKLSTAFIIYPFIAFGILYTSWPFLWSNPLGKIIKVLTYYKDIGYSVNYQSNNYLLFEDFNIFAIKWIFFTTPVIILILSALGIIYAIGHGMQEKNKTALFILLWFLIPILRVTVVPKAGIYLGVRQIMEFVPAMAILSGIGAQYIVVLLNGYITKHFKQFNLSIKPLFLLQILIILSFVPIALKLVSIHPNENVFFNFLIGGVNGAKEKNIPYWGSSFGNVYKQGANWINANAQKNAKVDLAVGYEESMPRVWLRKDINYSNQYRKDFPERKGEYIIEMTGDMPTWPPFCYWVYVQNFLVPVHEVKVDGVAILTIWKNDKEHTKLEFLQNDRNYILNNCIKREEYK